VWRWRGNSSTRWRCTHEQAAEPDGGEAGVARRFGVARARRQSDPHRRGQADAQRRTMKVREGMVDGDLVRREGGDTESAHRQGGAV